MATKKKPTLKKGDYFVKDIKLAEDGRKEIELAEHEMAASSGMLLLLARSGSRRST